MRQRRIAFGPGAASLILIVVILCMSMLAMLTIASARNDEKLSLRSAAMTEDIYSLNVKAEESLAGLDEMLVSARQGSSSQDSYLQEVSTLLPEGMNLEGNIVTWKETSTSRVLVCAVRLTEPMENARYEWVDHHLIMDEMGVTFDD